MEPTFVVIAVLILFGILALVGMAIGLDKGRGAAGFFLGLFFGPLGLIAVAAMHPSKADQRVRDQDLARAIAEMMSMGTASLGEVSRICPFCAEMVLAEAVVCRYCGRDLPALAADPARSGREPFEEDADAPGVTVALGGCDGAVGATCGLNLRVEPGYVLVDVRQAACDNAAHVLVLSVAEADEACQRLRIAASHAEKGAQTTGPQKRSLAIDWNMDADGGDQVSFDWAAGFLDADELAMWEAGDRPDEADCGTIYLSGDLSAPESEVATFERALSGCAHLAHEWQAGRANEGYVRTTLSAYGHIFAE